MNRPFISIVIPTFNSGKTIGDCLESLSIQTFKEIEIMVVDGASSDTTIEQVKSFAQKNPFIKWKSEKDKGIYDAINKGIRVSAGEWIYVLGSDDRLFASNTLAEMSEYLKKSASELVYGNVMVKGDAGWAKDGQIHDGEFKLEKLVQRNICQQAVFYRKSLFDKLGYFKLEYPICADWDFALRAASKFRLEYVNIIVAIFNGGGASKTMPEEKFYDEYATNMFDYFGFRIFRKEFKSVAWRFKAHAKLEKEKGRGWKSFFYNLVAKRLQSK